ncbi:MAG: hypothetical protein PHG25_03815 [Candidatus Pacebacteria bacterium]|nr:hypothetical protein [Candidatus Paceibacterota bacterium]
MSAESFNTFQEHLGHPEISEKDLRHTYALMQLELASDTLGFEPDNEAFDGWIGTYAADFGVIATEHPELILQYQNGGEEGRKALTEVQHLLHEKHVAHA